jgi:hypothetical protein
MAGLFSKVARFAQSPQGRRAAGQAKKWASKPENRAKIDSYRKRLTQRGRP